MLKFIAVIFTLSGCGTATAEEFLAAADMSHTRFFEDRGITYHAEGQPQDAFTILKASGLNCVRLRLFTSSAEQASADPYNAINNLEYTLPLAVRVKQAGLRFLLNFHYSDTWADPGKQTQPAAWTPLSFLELEQQMYDYNSNTLATFQAADALPDYVQIGNEITSGLLWPDGKVSGSYNTSWNQLGRLMKAAIRGIQDACGAQDPKIIIHIDRGGDWSTTQWFFDNLNYQQVPYDMIGQSFYPWWHGDFEDLQTCLSNTVLRYQKPVLVMETAFPWTNSTYNPNLGIPSTEQGQVDYTVELAGIVKGLPHDQGAGIFWWGSEYVRLNGYNLAGFDRTSFFDYGGNVLPVVRTLGQLTAPVALRASQEDNRLLLQWPLSGSGLSLSSTTDPTPTALWTAVTNAATLTNGVFHVEMRVGTGPQQFYRLESH